MKLVFRKLKRKTYIFQYKLSLKKCLNSLWSVNTFAVQKWTDYYNSVIVKKSQNSINGFFPRIYDLPLKDNFKQNYDRVVIAVQNYDK